ncbi:hypothetical protein HLB23_33725 [Nocardia uniformis]|uniref:Phthiocerol/phthiodiolone dimycocerosyl transferase n=1 Tax=Nocardia uniformis TaxID=53432 RepID=A0A849C7V6_9NOCA|nr:hypothetical protein [Nocardia uniformis]NNH74754.1 hypothetical protein [Nocardia uniformis]
MSVTTTAARDITRPLSPSERWFWIIDQISPSNCSGRVWVRGRVTPEQLDRAAAAVVAEYPLLRVGVEHGADFDPRFVPLPEPRIPLRRVSSDDPEAWQREIDAEMREPFDSAMGMVRLVDVVHAADTAAESHDLILTVSHVIADGRSLISLLRKLIEYGSTGADPVVRAPIPPADDLIPTTARGAWRYLYTTLYDQVVALVRRPRLLRGASRVPLAERVTRVVHRRLDAEQLAALVTDCRAAGVTVHGALAGAVALAIGKTVRPNGSGVTGIGSPVDFRPALTPAPAADELGIYAPVLANFVRFGARASLWSAARSVNQQLRRGVRQQRHLATVAGMRYGTPKSLETGWRFVELIDRRAPWNVSVTNLGRIDFPAQLGEWHLSNLSIAAGNSCVSALTVAVTTAHNEMHIEFCYVEGMLTPTGAEEFADRVLATLTDRTPPPAN